MSVDMDKVYCENCLDTMKRMSDGFIDITITSPPYDNLRKYNGYEFDFEAIASELYRVTKDGGVVVWVVGDATIKGSETGTSFRQALYFMKCGFNLHDTMIYQKKNYTPLTHNRYEQSWEYMFVFSKNKLAKFNPIKIPCKGAGEMEKYGLERRGEHDSSQAMRYSRETVFIKIKPERISPNIFTYALGRTRSGHPAPFPDQLAHDHISSWSNKGDLVYDPMMGSGTVALSAVSLNRNWIGSEISQEYCDMINERLTKRENE